MDEQIGRWLAAWVDAVRRRPWRTLGWLVAVAVLADWTENLLLLTQMHRYIEGGGSALQSAWIALASVATTLKLTVFVVTSLVVLALSGTMSLRALK